MDSLGIDLGNISMSNNIADDVSAIKDNVFDIENSVGNIVGKVNSIGDLIGTTLSIGTFASMSKMLWEMDSAVTKLAARTGQGAKGVKELKSAVVELQTSLGASSKNATAMVSALAKKNYVGNLKEAAKNAYMFSDATGLSVENTASLSNELSKVAKLNENSIKQIFEGITAVQQANGISEEGMESLSAHIQENITNMIAFGRTEKEIKNMTKSTAKLVSSFEKVGISARTSLGWVEKLTNPDNVTENIGLYSQLGISMSDALSGGDITGQLQTGMKEFGQKLKGMGVVAGSAYAKAFGISYSDAIKAADAEEVGETEDADLNSLANNARGIADKLQLILNKGSGVIFKMPALLMTGLAVLNPLLKRTGKDTAEETASVFTKSFKKGMDEVIANTKKNLEGTKGLIGSIFDSSEMKKARAEMNDLIGLTFWEKVSSSALSVLDPFNAGVKNLKKFTIEYGKKDIRADKVKRENLQSLLKSDLNDHDKAIIQKRIDLIDSKYSAGIFEKLGDLDKKNSVVNLKKQYEDLVKEQARLRDVGLGSSDIYKESIKNLDKVKYEIFKLGDEYEISTKKADVAIKELLGKFPDDLENSLNEAANSGGTRRGFKALLTKMGTTKNKNGEEFVPETGKQIGVGILKNIGKGLGKIAGPMVLISGLLSLLSGPLEEFKEALKGPMSVLSQVFSTVLSPFIPIFSNLIEATMPILLGILKGLLFAVSPLVGVIGHLMSAILHVISWFKKDDQALLDSAEQMKGLGKTLRDSARAIDVNTKAQQENTEQMETTKGNISVGSDGYLVKSAGYVSSSTSSNSVNNYNTSNSKTSNSVKIEKSSEEERKEDQDRKVNEMSFKELVKQNENLESLKTMMMFNNPAAMAYGVGSKLFGAIRNS
jgi:hypothetical protein